MRRRRLGREGFLWWGGRGGRGGVRMGGGAGGWCENGGVV
jgi:hypothetical protein